MSATYGKNFKITIFGESHGPAIGITLDGLQPGFSLDMDKISIEMQRRAPGKNKVSTQRKEPDMPEILSGYFENKTTGAPLCAIIKNNDTRSKDYGDLQYSMRPGHSDYSAFVKYQASNDFRGGGHFSGRLTAPIVFAGAVAKQLLEQKNIYIGSHIKSIKDVSDQNFDPINIEKSLLDNLHIMEIPAIRTDISQEYEKKILEAKMQEESVGGVIECAAIGIMPGVGEPFFDSLESNIAHLMFSVPAVKAIEFGAGFDITQMFGSQSNDTMYYDGHIVKTKTNNNGGITGGITNGMPVIFRVAIKPTSSISKTQDTINIKDKTNTKLDVIGRHDPCIVQRAIPVIEAMAAIAIYDMIREMERSI